MNEIVILGNKLIVREVADVKEYPVEVLQKLVSNLTSISTPRLPNSCVQFFKEKKKSCYLIEIDEGLRNIEYMQRTLSRTKYMANILLPWMYISVGIIEKPLRISDVSIFFSHNQFSSIEDKCGIMSFPNVNRYGNLCTGSIAVDDNPLLHQIINDMVLQILTGSFNEDHFGKAELKSINPIPEVIDAVENNWSAVEEYILSKDQRPKTSKKIIEDIKGSGLDREYGMRYIMAWEFLSHTLSPEKWESIYGELLPKKTFYDQFMGSRRR